MRIFSYNPGFYSLYLVLTVLFFTITPASDFQDTASSEHYLKKVKLKKNARANGYKIIHQSGEFYLEATKVADPVTKKLIEGLHRLLYRCSQNGPELPVSITFDRGNSARVSIGCLIPFEPQILLLDEPIGQ